LADAVTQLEARLPKVARLLEEAEDDVLAFFALPAEHWSKLRSTNEPPTLSPTKRASTS
jgi:transposase-like protein